MDGPWPAPAKLNLFLHVVGRRPDGYHLLQTLFQFLDWGDELWLRPREDGRILRLEGPEEVPAEEDLAVRAARLLQAEAGVGRGVELRVRKRLPLGGGLGGGSSDAATALVALSRLWGLGLGEEELAALGLRLGADVPVFVRGRAAWAEGVGERLRPVEPPEPWYLVLHPGVAVATAEVFGDAALTRDSPTVTISDFLAGRCRNDCEAVVRRRFPEVARALDWLGAFAPARLTGTGACLFAAFPERAAAEAVARRVPAPWRAWVARGRNRSPLLDRVGDRAGGRGGPPGA